MLERCLICKKNYVESEHHISYFPEKKIKCCKFCHWDIHHGGHPELIQYTPDDEEKFNLFHREGYSDDLLSHTIQSMETVKG